jgi:hypothetical protein
VRAIQLLCFAAVSLFANGDFSYWRGQTASIDGRGVQTSPAAERVLDTGDGSALGQRVVRGLEHVLGMGEK